MNGVDDLIATFTARQHGLIARWQALGVGIADHVLDDRIRRGILIRVHPGVYRLRGVRYTQELRWLAAVLAGGAEARLSHLAAGAFQRFELKRVKPEITVPHTHNGKIDGVEVHWSRRLGDRIVVNGIPVTTPARTMLDIASLKRPDFHLLVQNAVADKAVRVEALLSIVDRRGGPGVDGTVALRVALEDGLVDEKIERRLELHLARIIARARVPKPVRQHRLICADGREVFLDNAWPDRTIAIEGDGRRWHGNAHQAAKTRARNRSIAASGWTHYVYGWSEATELADATRLEIESLWSCSPGLEHADHDQTGGEAA